MDFEVHCSSFYLLTSPRHHHASGCNRSEIRTAVVVCKSFYTQCFIFIQSDSLYNSKVNIVKLAAILKVMNCSERVLVLALFWHSVTLKSALIQ